MAGGISVGSTFVFSFIVAWSNKFNYSLSMYKDASSPSVPVGQADA